MLHIQKQTKRSDIYPKCIITLFIDTAGYHEYSPLGFNADVVEISMLGGIMALLMVLIGIHCARWRSDSKKTNVDV